MDGVGDGVPGCTLRGVRDEGVQGGRGWIRLGESSGGFLGSYLPNRTRGVLVKDRVSAERVTYTDTADLEG